MDPATHAYAHWNRWEQTQRQGKGAREENTKQHQIEMAGGGDTETERHQERSSKRVGETRGTNKRNRNERGGNKKKQDSKQDKQKATSKTDLEVERRTRKEMEHK